MGTFAGIFTQTGKTIPENKRNEFAEKIVKIFQAGGMMDIEQIQLYGKRISLLCKARMQGNEMDFYYNYFEDDFWENAGFNMESCHVWSNKIGWGHFHQAVVAAYVLEEQYTEGVSIAMVNNDPETSWGYVGWLNYLFNEKRHVKNFDPWRLFETIHYSEEKEEYMEWNNFGKNRYAFIGGCEICAVLKGYEKALAIYSAKEKGKLEEIAISGMTRFVENLGDYKNNCKKDKEHQLQALMEAIRIYYEKDMDTINSLYANDEKLKHVLAELFISDAPAFIIKVISEIYEVEFWDLWEEICDVAKRKVEYLYGNNGHYVLPISTETFFRQSPDDMIPYWAEGCDLLFSEELQNWFKALKEQYDNLLNTGVSIDNVLKYIVDLLEEVNDNYYHIFAFSDFFEESLENLIDKRYQALWRMFDNMIHDPEMQKIGDVVFVPEGPGHEKEGLHYLGKQPKRRLICNWDFMGTDKRNNKARVTFRRYMALVANKELRSKVFGF